MTEWNTNFYFASSLSRRMVFNSINIVKGGNEVQLL